MSEPLQAQLAAYLADAYSIERQAKVQMQVAPRLAADPGLAVIFRAHLEETEEHERLIRERLEAHGESPSKLKDVVMAAGGVGFSLFARVQPDTPGKLTAHSYSFEHLEIASYELLARVADRADDSETANVAREIIKQERAMAERLEGVFDLAVEASLRAQGTDDMDGLIADYLADAHAIEVQAITLMERAAEAEGPEELRTAFSEKLEESRAHKEALELRLNDLDSSRSKIKDAALRLGALNWATFFKGHPDTSGKLAAFVYAFEHLEIGSYELLKRTADRAGDSATVGLVDSILSEERAAAERLAGLFDVAVDAALAEQGIAAAGVSS